MNVSCMCRLGLVLTCVIGLGLVAPTPVAATPPSYTITDLGTLGGAWSEAYGINGAGDVVGDSGTSGNNTHAFRYSSGSMTDLGTLGGSTSTASGINNSGHVAGYAHNGTVYRAYRHDGSFTSLGTLPGGSGGDSFGNGINNSGQVVGHSYNGTYYEAFLYSGGSMTGLGTLGGSHSVAWASTTSGR